MDDWMHSKRGVALNQVRHWKREAGGGDIRCPALPLSCYRGSWRLSLRICHNLKSSFAPKD